MNTGLYQVVYKITKFKVEITLKKNLFSTTVIVTQNYLLLNVPLIDEDEEGVAPLPLLLDEADVVIADAACRLDGEHCRLPLL